MRVDHGAYGFILDLLIQQHLAHLCEIAHHPVKVNRLGQLELLHLAAGAAIGLGQTAIIQFNQFVDGLFLRPQQKGRQDRVTTLDRFLALEPLVARVAGDLG